MKLKRTGFFRELRHGLPNGPSLREAIREQQASPDAHRILSYLQNGAVLVACPGVVRNALKEKGQIIGSPHIRTDGVWAWPSDLAYYVMRYNVELPKEFVELMEHNGWQPPIIDRIQLATLKLDD